MNPLSTIVIANPGWHNEREVHVGDLSLGWRANGVGRASCHMRARDAHLLGFSGLFGKWVWTNGPLGPWAGYVEDMPSVVGDGIIELSCADFGGLLGSMITPRTYRQTSSSPGALMVRAIKDGGTDTGSWFSAITADEDGAPVTVEWRGEQVERVVQSLAGGAGGYWNVTTDTDRAISFTYQQSPIDKRGSILLIEGRNVIAGSIRPSISQLVNDILAIANDRDWQRAAGARVYDESSIRLYDRRRETRRYQGHTRKSSLETVARADLAASSLPSGPVSLDIISTNPIVPDLRVGYLVSLWSSSQNRIYDLVIVGLAQETSRGTVTVVGSAVEAG